MSLIPSKFVRTGQLQYNTTFRVVVIIFIRIFLGKYWGNFARAVQGPGDLK